VQTPAIFLRLAEQECRVSLLLVLRALNPCPSIFSLSCSQPSDKDCSALDLCSGDLAVVLECFGCGRTLSHCLMTTDLVILFEPLVDDGLGLASGCKPFCVENFSAKRSVEVLVISVLVCDPG
jgi:hypothetical protein